MCILEQNSQYKCKQHGAVWKESKNTRYTNFVHLPEPLKKNKFLLWLIVMIGYAEENLKCLSFQFSISRCFVFTVGTNFKKNSVKDLNFLPV